jgi:hypothetical protein
MKPQYIRTSCGAEYNKKIWAPAENFPGIYCIDINNYNVTVPVIFENEKIESIFYEHVLIYNEKLYLMPRRAAKFVVYDLNNKIINEYATESGLDSKYGGIVENKGKIYLVPCTVDSILIYDVKSEKVNYIKIRDKLRQIIKLNNNEQMTGCCEIVEDKIYMPLLYHDAIAIYDIENQSIGVTSLNTECTGYQSSTQYEGILYLLGNDNLIYEFDIHNLKLVNKIELDKYENKSSLFGGIVIIKGHLITIPNNQDIIYDVNLNDRNVNKVCFSEKYTSSIYNENTTKYEGYVYYNDKIYFLPRTTENMIVYDLCTRSISKIRLVLDDKTKVNIMKKMNQQSNARCENSELDLSIFVDMILSEKIYSHNKEILSYGKTVYEVIKGDHIERNKIESVS